MAIQDITVIYNFISEEERVMLLDYEKSLTERIFGKKEIMLIQIISGQIGIFL